MIDELNELENDNEIFFQTNETRHTYEISTQSLAIITTIINLFFVFLTTYLLLRRVIILRNPLQLYIQNIVFCNFFVAGGHLVGAVRILAMTDVDGSNNDKLCVFQSIFTTYANLATFFWMMMIEWSAYRLMLDKPAPLKYGSWFIHLLCWTIPAFIVSLAMVNGVLGEDQEISWHGYCWIRHSKDWKKHLLWGLLTAKGWELITIFATVNFYFYNFCFFKRRTSNDPFLILMSNNENMRNEGSDGNTVDRENQQKDLLWECRGLALLPLNLMILRIWGTTRFWIDISIDANEERKYMRSASIILLHLQSIGDSSLAFFNFVLLAVVKWSQITDAYPSLKNFRLCQWLSKRQSIASIPDLHNALTQENGTLHACRFRNI